MFEYGIVSLIISPTVYWLALLKITVSGGLHNKGTIVLLILRLVVMSIINALKMYTRYIMTLEGKGAYESVIKSCNLAYKNMKETLKYARIQAALIVNFSLNLFVILLIPIIFIYIAIVFNIIQYPAVKWTVYGIFMLGILFGAYASSMIRAFFAYFWQEIYKNLPKKN